MKTKMVLYISYDGLTDALGQSQILSYLARLSSPALRFVVLSFEKPDNYQKNAAYVSEVVKGADITWKPLWYHKKPPVISTLKDIYTGIRTAKALQKTYGFDVIHCRGYISGLIGRAVKGPKLIFDMRGWMADERKDAGAWNRPLYRPVYRYFKSLEKKLFREADYSVSLTHAGKTEIVAKGYSSPEKVGVVPTCVNLDVFKPYDPVLKEQMREKLGIPLQSKVLVYSGGIGENYEVGRMIKIFLGFLSVYPDGFILILSKDPAPENFLGQLHGAGIQKVLVKSVTYREVTDYLRTGDAGMIFYTPAYSNIGRSPTKLAEYWASGLPVISFENIGDLEMIFQKYPLGGVICKEDLSDVAARVAELQFGNERELRQYAMDYSGLEKGIKFYSKVYDKLIPEDA